MRRLARPHQICVTILPVVTIWTGITIHAAVAQDKRGGTSLKANDTTKMNSPAVGRNTTHESCTPDQSRHPPPPEAKSTKINLVKKQAVCVAAPSPRADTKAPGEVRCNCRHPSTLNNATRMPRRNSRTPLTRPARRKTI